MKNNVIAVNNNKGGILKTSLVTNLAGVLLSEGHNVLIIDCDNQANAAVSFGINPDTLENTLYEVLVENLPAEQAIVTAYQSESGCRVDILPSNDVMIGFEFEVLKNTNKYPEYFNLLKDKCDYLREKYDYILVDSMPNMGLVAGNIFTFADHVLLPFSPEPFAMRSLVKALETIADFKEGRNERLNVLGIVGTLVNMGTNLHSDIITEVKGYCSSKGVRFCDTQITRSIRYASAVAYDKIPMTLTDKKHTKPSIFYYELWKEIKGDVEKANWSKSVR